ncbi:MAG: phosphotransferase [Patescibacteria group bacterium]
MKNNITDISIESQMKNKISDYFSSKVLQLKLLRETDVSYLYLAELSNIKILAKQYKNISIKHEYENQLYIYTIINDHYQNKLFRVPRPFFFSESENFFTMEYIPDAKNFLDLLFILPLNQVQQLSQKVGLALYEYHVLLTKYLSQKKKSIYTGDSMQELFKTKKGSTIKKIIDKFPENTTSVIYRDFTPTNIMFRNDEIYFIDFQTICYTGPFFYDLARFQDVTRIFSFLKHPFSYLYHRKTILMILDQIVQGYNEKKYVDRNLLKMASFIHHKEHAIMKNKNKFNKYILKFLYLINI